MANILDRDNQHLLLEKGDNTNNSFIANINLLVKHLKDVLEVNDKFSKVQVEELSSLVNVDITELVDDIRKGTKDGGRKIDIDLFKNYKEYDENASLEVKQTLYADASKAPKYNSADVYFTDNSVLNIPFKQDNINTPISTNNELYNQLINSVELSNKRENTMIVEAPVEVSTVMVRLYDDNKASNIYKIVMNTTTPNLIKSTNTLSYAWVDYTSSLQVLTTYIAKLLEVFERLDEIISLPVEADKLLQNIKDEGASQIADIIVNGNSEVQKILNTSDSEVQKILSNGNSEVQRVLSTAQPLLNGTKDAANRAENAWNSLNSASAVAVSVPSTSPASASLQDGVFTFDIPRAEDGQRPVGLSIGNFEITPNDGKLRFVVQQCDFDSCDAFINDKGELILELKNPNGGN